MKVHGYCSHRHYADHLLPILSALPDGLRGNLYVQTERLAAELSARGDRVFGPEATWRSPMPDGDPVLVAGFHDVRAVRRDRPLALVEHGAGQTYVGVRDGSYAGGRGRGRVGLFLCPGRRVADLNRAAYPDARVEVVGSARLDVLWKARSDFARQRDGNCLAVSFHWPCPLVPESGSSWDAFRDDVSLLAADGGWVMLGHGHPRHFERMARWWRRLGVEPVAEWLSVVRRADVYVCDNSSTMFEACAVGLPVVVANGRAYRRSVEHGLRFWTYAGMGPQVWPGDDLAAAATEARDGFVLERGWVAGEVYELLPDGRGEATLASVEAVVRWATR